MKSSSVDSARLAQVQEAIREALAALDKREGVLPTPAPAERSGLRDKVHGVHAHASFDRLGRYVQFHSGRTHETVALIDLNELPALNWTK